MGTMLQVKNDKFRCVRCRGDQLQLLTQFSSRWWKIPPPLKEQSPPEGLAAPRELCRCSFLITAVIKSQQIPAAERLSRR